MSRNTRNWSGLFLLGAAQRLVGAGFVAALLWLAFFWATAGTGAS